jgi:hypothetical protein
MRLHHFGNFSVSKLGAKNRAIASTLSVYIASCTGKIRAQRNPCSLHSIHSPHNSQYTLQHCPRSRDACIAVTLHQASVNLLPLLLTEL